jgi:hypothetical protein
MTPQELSIRQARAEHETLVISKTEEGFRVYAPTGKARPYFVTGTADAPSCTCPDFQNHKEDPTWRCKHVLAVFKVEEGGASANAGNGGAQASANGGRGRTNGPAQMILKRSVSPDGRIDALSVEFAYPVANVPSQEIERQAGAVLRSSSRPSSPSSWAAMARTDRPQWRSQPLRRPAPRHPQLMRLWRPSS